MEIKDADRKKKIKAVSHPDVEKATYYWFVQQRQNYLPISIKMIQMQARNYHMLLCKKDSCVFSASYGWAQKFISKHQMRSLKISGEKLSSDIPAVDPMSSKWV